MDRRSAEALTGYRACLRPFCLSLNLGVPDAARPPSGAGGRYWDRTSDLFGVKADAFARVLTSCGATYSLSCAFVLARIGT